MIENEFRELKIEEILSTEEKLVPNGKLTYRVDAVSTFVDPSNNKSYFYWHTFDGYRHTFTNRSLNGNLSREEAFSIIMTAFTNGYKLVAESKGGRTISLTLDFR